MSVRRLADEALQPKDFAFTGESREWAKGQIAKYPPGRQASAVIPLLWKAQEQVGGWTPRKAIEEVAAMLDLPFIRVLEIATFYTMFNLAPIGRHHVQLCGTVPCHLCGALDLKKICEERIGPQGSGVGGRQVLLDRGRMPGRLLQRSDGADQLRLLRGSRCRELRQAPRRSCGRTPGKGGLADRAACVRSPSAAERLSPMRHCSTARGSAPGRRVSRKRRDDSSKDAPPKASGAARPSGESGGPAVPGSGRQGSRAPARRAQGSRRGARGLASRQCRAGGRTRRQGRLKGQGAAGGTGKKPRGNSPGKR